MIDTPVLPFGAEGDGRVGEVGDSGPTSDARWHSTPDVSRLNGTAPAGTLRYSHLDPTRRTYRSKNASKDPQVSKPLSTQRGNLDKVSAVQSTFKDARQPIPV